MGEQGEANMAQILVNIQAQLTTLTKRMTRMEQPQPARRGPIRGVNGNRANPEDEDMPDLDDDPPPDPDLNQRPRRQHNRESTRRRICGNGGSVEEIEIWFGFSYITNLMCFL
ncbi:unnamed protein product [Arabis nemorensis]|uniref:Uncharacterized protein n=1 Tax=Arabis nemorensis TaxID=586526 RepID=A0A565CVI7_9BRAS|nr:unnamed protein product [Arabis nemorensis]